MNNTYVSIQRWIYVGGDSVPNVLRSLAEVIEEFEIPCGERDMERENTIVEIVYSNEAEEEERYRAGICLSWKVGTDEDPAA